MSLDGFVKFVVVIYVYIVYNILLHMYSTLRWNKTR